MIVGLNISPDLAHLGSTTTGYQRRTRRAAPAFTLIPSFFQIFTFHYMLSDQLNHLCVCIDIVLSQISFFLEKKENFNA